MRPEFEAAAADILGVNSSVLVASVDISVEVDLAARFYVEDAPALKFVVDGEEEASYMGDPSR